MSRMRYMFANDQVGEGQGMVEYGLIIALVSIVVIAALTAIGGALNTKFEEVNNKLA